MKTHCNNCRCSQKDIQCVMRKAIIREGRDPKTVKCVWWSPKIKRKK